MQLGVYDARVKKFNFRMNSDRSCRCYYIIFEKNKNKTKNININMKVIVAFFNN